MDDEDPPPPRAAPNRSAGGRRYVALGAVAIVRARGLVDHEEVLVLM